jgi:hypothetical protein
MYWFRDVLPADVQSGGSRSVAAKPTKKAPPKWGCREADADYCMRRRVKARPARPRLRRARVPGSGTEEALIAYT